MKATFISTLIIILFFQNSVFFRCNNLRLHVIFEKDNKVPDSFIVNTPFKYNGKEHNIQITCERSQNNSVMITKVTSDLLLPKNFHTILENDFSLRNFYFPDNYETAYKEYATNKFIGDWLAIYKRNYFRDFSPRLLYIVDVDDDGYDDLLLLDLQNSMRDNNVYVMFKGDKNGVSYKENFFDKVAFYGWDKTGKYLITGISDTRERKLYKNKIVRGKLKVVDQCTEYAVSDKFCW